MNPPKGKAAKVADKAVEMYSERAALRATISAIPWIGSSIDAFLFRRTKSFDYQPYRKRDLLDCYWKNQNGMGS